MNEFEKLFRPLTPEEYEKRIVEYIKEFCYQNPDGTWSADGDVFLFRMKLTKLPVRFKEVKGNFICSFNNLTSLEGGPKIVKGDFYCIRNKLTSLEGAPMEVGGSFFCFSNELTSLEGAPKKVGWNFDCSFNKLTSLEKISRKIGGRIIAIGNLKLEENLMKTIGKR